MGPGKEGADLPPKVPKPSPPPPQKEHVPKLKIFPSEKLFRRKSTFVDYPFKHKGSSVDSFHNKVTRSGSQTKRKVSPSDVMPKRRMSASEPRFQRRISLTEFPGSRKISPSGSPPYQKLGSGELNGELKNSKRKKLSKALTLTHDPTYHQEGLSDMSPSPYSIRKFFPDHSVSTDDKTFSAESLSPYYQPKESLSDLCPYYGSKSPSRESIPQTIQPVPVPVKQPLPPQPLPSPLPPPVRPPKPQTLKPDPSSSEKKSFPSELHPSNDSIKETNDNLTPLQKRPPLLIQPLLSKQKSITETPKHYLKRQLSGSERESHKSRLKASKRKEIPYQPPVPLFPSSGLSPIDTLPQLIRRASCKPAPIDYSTLISLPSSTLVQETSMPPVSRQQSLPAEPYPPKPRESKRYERFH